MRLTLKLELVLGLVLCMSTFISCKKHSCNQISSRNIKAIEQKTNLSINSILECANDTDFLYIRIHSEDVFYKNYIAGINTLFAFEYSRLNGRNSNLKIKFENDSFSIEAYSLYTQNSLNEFNETYLSEKKIDLLLFVLNEYKGSKLALIDNLYFQVKSYHSVQLPSSFIDYIIGFNSIDRKTHSIIFADIYSFLAKEEYEEYLNSLELLSIKLYDYKVQYSAVQDSAFYIKQ